MIQEIIKNCLEQRDMILQKNILILLLKPNKEKQSKIKIKDKKNTKYVCKRGSYLDDAVKTVKIVPGPDKYKIEKDWISKADIEKGKKKPSKTQRNTYIDFITKEAKARPIPGVGKYNLEKTAEQLKKEQEELSKKAKLVKKLDKESFLSEYEFLGKLNPGPGQYNPHKDVRKQKPTLSKPEDWRKKHKGSDKLKKLSTPDMGTYKNNFPSDYPTFGKLLAEAKDKKQSSKIHYLGTTERFKDPKKSKALVLNVPGAGQYNLLLEWSGKTDPKKKEKPKNFLNSITRGISKSIYY
eukprot:TRINITY_DN1443_c0_g2_i3.p2 TRINITY_DN1443_c0_g2~~TRINITY_DN1443_c0_g2_i3.p2  ORF type:complete len:295 (-),score=84.47 TRINITY_DN1443_c0_g2_i3:291-1175(-)